jgi:hypothetical protein
MKPDWHDPETRSILNARKTERDNEWLRKQIGEATYLRSLMVLGYPLDEARMELNQLRDRQ